VSRAAAAFLAAALCEIAGCYAVWMVLRLGRPAWWLLPGMALLAAFATILALVPSASAGRAFAAYGGVYVAASLAWLWAVEGVRPDRWDLVGGVVAVCGAAIVLAGPRGG